MSTPTLMLDGHESLSMLVQQCPLPAGGPGAGMITLYETVGGHLQDWWNNGPFRFDSATVLDSSNGRALWVLTGVEVSGFQKAPPTFETIPEYAAAIQWADAKQVSIAPMSMRERFEALHPVPDGVQFDEHLKVYYVQPGPHSPAKQLHCMCWSMWVESRAEMVVQMPDAHSYTAPDVAGAAILDCMAAIRSAGVKVRT